MISGLVLSGGLSTRMQRDKGSLIYGYGTEKNEDQRKTCYRLLKRVFENVYVSCRRSQADLIPPDMPRIYDSVNNGSPDGGGPAVGILSAFNTNRSSAWFILACDMPFVN